MKLYAIVAPYRVPSTVQMLVAILKDEGLALADMAVGGSVKSGQIWTTARAARILSDYQERFHVCA